LLNVLLFAFCECIHIFICYGGLLLTLWFMFLFKRCVGIKNPVLVPLSKRFSKSFVKCAKLFVDIAFMKESISLYPQNELYNANRSSSMLLTLKCKILSPSLSRLFLRFIFVDIYMCVCVCLIITQKWDFYFLIWFVCFVFIGKLMTRVRVTTVKTRMQEVQELRTAQQQQQLPKLLRKTFLTWIRSILHFRAIICHSFMCFYNLLWLSIHIDISTAI
jgi:hypothetical protein